MKIGAPLQEMFRVEAKLMLTKTFKSVYIEWDMNLSLLNTVRRRINFIRVNENETW